MQEQNENIKQKKNYRKETILELKNTITELKKILRVQQQT